MLSYAIGLDIGITSVGWATVALDEEDRPFGIIDMGSRIFDAAEQPKTGESLAAPRRAARGARRRLRRRRHRNERIRALIVDSGLLTQAQLDALFDGQLSDVYALRVKALDEPVTNPELARILIHISQRRGFRSNRKGAATQEDGQLLTAVNENKARMAANGYRTVGEMYRNDPVYREIKRNKGGKYISTVSRDMIEDEVHRIFSAQRTFGNPAADEKLEEAYTAILLSQRSFDDGPGGNSPYAGNQIKRMIGRCTLEPDKIRAAKATYSFELFSLLEAINHIQIISGGQRAPLSEVQRQILIELAHQTANLDYFKIRKALALPETYTFNMVSYGRDDISTAEKKTKFPYLRAYHQMRTAFERAAKGHFAGITREQRNAIGQTLSIYKTSEKIRPLLGEAGLSEADIDIAETLSFSKFGHISVEACDRIIPYLEKGMRYNDACTAAGYAFKAHDGEEKSHLLPALDEEAKNTITSPVVLRAVSQTIKVVNAIIRERGCSPTFLNIELAREMSRDFSERNKIKKAQDDNRAENERIMERIRTEYGIASPTGQDLVKLRLFEEQDRVCAYSLKQMSPSHLFEPGYAEVDHIIPYSISFDDSRKNKVLVFAKENRDKGNRLPLQYLTGKRREDFIVWVNASVRDSRKRQNLLKENLTPAEQEGFRERNLQDTKTASVFLKNYISDNLEFASFRTSRKKHVTAVNGVITSYMRRRWGISKIRENGDLHHAVDALVIACTTDGMIQRASRYAQYRETLYTQDETSRFVVDPDTGEVVGQFPYPWPDFRKELEARLSADPEWAVIALGLPLYDAGEVIPRPLFVSRMPRRKVSGPAHLETIKSPPIALEDGTQALVVKTELTKLKLDKSGEIAGYYMPQSDRLLYEALKAQLAKFGGDGKKAFAEPFRKPKRDGTPGPVVNKVKICEKTTSYVPVHGGKGSANNDSMIRIDVFHVEGDGYYFVPIYVADTLKPELPNRACVKKKPYSQWKEMKDNDFLFSLYPNDLVLLTSARPLNMKLANEKSTLGEYPQVNYAFLYYNSADIDGARLSFESHENGYELRIGIKTLESLEKYTVDVLGRYNPVKKEKRQTFSGKER